MNSYINEIEHLIELQIRKSINNQVVIIRMEGFDSPILYKEVCKYFIASSMVELQGKLSKEKFEEFKEKNKNEWVKSIEFFKANELVDNEGSMTRWRNSSTEIIKDINQKYLVLLMGTEKIQDKGGLSDFYSITPEMILNSLKKNYGKWFESVLEENNINNKENITCLNTYFKALFKNENVNLMVLSSLIDEMNQSTFFSIDEVIQEISSKLNFYWNIPSILDEKYIPKYRNLKSGKVSSASILEKSFKFINRVPFSKGITKAALKKYERQIDEYIKDNDINIEKKFPMENPVFTSYSEFKDQLLDFIQGKNYIVLREKFLKLDYSIIEKIISIKIEKEDTKTTPDKKNKNIFGDPLQVYQEIIATSIYEYKLQYQELPRNIELRVNKIKLTNCATDEEKKELLYNLRCRLGGILKYICESDNEYIREIEINYSDNIDPFVNKNSSELESIIPIEKSENLNELSKINYSINLTNNDRNSVICKEYIYCFSIIDDWVNDFKLLNRAFLNNEENEYNRIPMYLECSNINNLVNCESDDEFFSNLQKIRVTLTEDEFRNDLYKIRNEEINNELGILIHEYKEFINVLNDSGFYYTITSQGCLKKLCDRYSNFINIVRNNYDKLTSKEKDIIVYVLNIFMMGDKSYEELKKGIYTNIILSPYHPVMLEKLYYKEYYMNRCFSECIDLINENQLNVDKINKRFDYASKMCQINSGVDIYSFSTNKMIACNEIHGKYAVYTFSENEDDFKDKSIGIGFEEDSEIDKKYLIRKTYKSNIISQNIIDYIKTFPSRGDGINILFINPDDMQHIVAGIHSVIDIIKDNAVDLAINIRILISHTRLNCAAYLKYWLDNCFETEKQIKIKTYLNYIDFNNRKIEEKLNKLINETDLSYLYSIFQVEDIEFSRISGQSIDSNIKYPATYTPMPVSISQESRKIDISQRQFNSVNEYLQLTHKYMRPNEVDIEYRAIKVLKIHDNNKKLIDFIHQKSRWVVCLDESIDKNLINDDNRKIIGFSTGKGIFGELNTTVSARNDIIIDLQKKLKNKLMIKFDKWLPDVAEKAANNCIEISKNLDGSKMLKALNPSDYEINNYLAYVLTMQTTQLYKEKDDYVVRTLINLDNYLHWFDDELSKDYMSGKKLRPDFLILEIKKSDELFNQDIPLRIKATVIEAKMGNENESYIDEAREQLIEGLCKLANNFSPNNVSINRRYWFNQLYRSIIFSKINMKDNNEKYDILINKISNIYNGCFEIEWNGYVYAYWTNVNNDQFNKVELEKPKNISYELKDFNLYTAGQIFIQKLLLPKDLRNTIDLEYSEEKYIDTSEFESEILDNNSHFKENKDYSSLMTNNNKNQERLSKNENSSIENRESTENIAGIRQEKFENIDRNLIEMNTQNFNSEVNYEKNIMNNTEKIDLKYSNYSKGYVRFLLGEDVKTREKIYWEYTNKELNNRHLLINGNSGCGKTYCIQTLILEAVKNNISVIVFDYTDGFTRSKLSPILLKKLGDKYESRIVIRKKFPINPFNKGKIIIEEEEFEELDQDIANRISDAFSKAYNFGPQQRSAIYVAVKEGLAQYGNSMTLDVLREKLEEQKNKSAETVISKILPVIDYEPFLENTDFSWKDIIEEHGKMYVIQLSGFSDEIKSILTELILWDIWNYAVRYGSEDIPIPIVLDEAQNISHDGNSPSGKILAEGRKFGLSGWYATQFMSGRLDKDEIGNLQQSAQKLYFNPPETIISEISKYIDVSSDGSKIWAEKLSKLTKGNCVTCGYKFKDGKFDRYQPRIIKISSLEERVNE